MVMASKQLGMRVAAEHKNTESKSSLVYPSGPSEAILARTYNPTCQNYSGDGSGRDSYIIMNNGGLTRENKKHMMHRQFKRSPVNIRPMPEKPAVAFRYQADGTGRDSYVIRNTTGLIRDYTSKKPDRILRQQLRAPIIKMNESVAALLHATDRSDFRTAR
mgnify:CR=1 FL=1